MSLIRRKHPLAECESCPLFKESCAPTTGPQDAKVAVVSRSPGYYDGLVGRPFANPKGAGAVLDYLLKSHGYSRDQVIATNIVLCETDDPPAEAVKACRPRLLADVANVDLIIAAGAEATSLFTRYRAVTSARSRSHEWEGKRVVVTNNPALVARNSDSFPDLVADFRLALDPLPEPTFPEVEVINDPSEGRNVLQRWINSLDGVLAADAEWKSSGEIVCAGFSRGGEKATVFGYGCNRDGGFRETLEQFFQKREVQLAWHNGKSDTKVFRREGYSARVDHDTFLMSYALDEEPGRHALDYLLMTEFGWPDYEPESVKHFKKTGEFLGETEEEKKNSEHELYTYNGWDAAGTYQLFLRFKERLIQEGLYERPYLRSLVPAANAITDVELRGFLYDVEEAANLNERAVLPRLQELTEGIRKTTGRSLLNPRSTKQMKAVYYDYMGLRHELRNLGQKKLESSTGKEVRKEILEGRIKCHPKFKKQLLELADLHETFQRIDKQRGTYIEGLIERTLQDGRLYPDFNIAGTVTGRPSSKNPNFQNITREGREGIPGIRTLFLPSSGCSLVSVDLSQAELRACAVLSGEAELLAIYQDNTRSLHKERAAAFYGKDYTHEEYVKSKNINFGVTYGQSAFAFAQMYHMPKSEAEEYIENWWKTFPRLLEWTKEVKHKAISEGRIQSPIGHVRRFHLITDENRSDLEREAVNFLPQNIAVWITLHAVIELVGMGVPIINTVHDNIIADVPNDDVMSTAALMKRTMEAQAKKILDWDLPFLADVSVSDKNWASVEEIELELAA